MDKGKTIIINEDVITVLKKEIEPSEYKFRGSIKRFLRDLLQDPINTQPNTFLLVNGFNRKKLINTLLKKNIIIRKQNIVDNDTEGNPCTAKMNVVFLVPKQNFERKLKRFYIETFEKNVPETKNIQEPFNNEVNVVDECTAGGCSGGTGATTASGVYCDNPSGVGFLQPMGDVQRRDMLGGLQTTKTKKK